MQSKRSVSLLSAFNNTVSNSEANGSTKRVLRSSSGVCEFGTPTFALRVRTSPRKARLSVTEARFLDHSKHLPRKTSNTQKAHKCRAVTASVKERGRYRRGLGLLTVAATENDGRVINLLA